MQADMPKQYLPLLGKTVIEHTVQRLLAHPNINRIVVALHPHDEQFSHLPIATSPHVDTVVGGSERADSVLNGLRAVSAQQWVLVHDAARPCIRKSDISKLLTLAEGNCGGILAKRVVDTMKRGDNKDNILHSEERHNLWHALTPQLFPCGQLRDALDKCLNRGQTITDEASAMEHMGAPVKLIEGRSDNIKITVPEDLALAKFFIRQQEQETCE